MPSRPDKLACLVTQEIFGLGPRLGLLAATLHEAVHVGLEALPATLCGSDKDSPAMAVCVRVVQVASDNGAELVTETQALQRPSHGQEPSNAVIQFAPVATDFGELRMYMAPSNVGGIRVKHDCSTAGLDLLAVARNARALVENHDNGARA
ncbi:uncharacterized protein GLRG_05373 [Colletotrichum graminicola M1.001]|uniref:Uncharacterized protein n=1 Tax=Colletotrichum graminicola (strain M1.001 / M2 / FGSC 10212) TaxID=645133 RepID=E3QH67_COLGM|nr:uncharacterized protein GLRG_05373 [Colletotrichum graminicola M1.001]EFQ30229.1 hypothetical protein GLRG_05373 [Colletotrichum graminicola M1.001]